MDLGEGFPSPIGRGWNNIELGSTAYVHVILSVIDWCAFALWQKGELVRALSVAVEDVDMDAGDRLPFETPFWDSFSALGDEFKDDDPDAFPYFGPMELSETALLAMLGFQFEGDDDWVCNPEEIPIMKFEISKKPWWKFW